MDLTRIKGILGKYFYPRAGAAEGERRSFTARDRAKRKSRNGMAWASRRRNRR